MSPEAWAWEHQLEAEVVALVIEDRGLQEECPAVVCLRCQEVAMAAATISAVVESAVRHSLTTNLFAKAILLGNLLFPAMYITTRGDTNKNI